jgi:hypothetical protein
VAQPSPALPGVHSAAQHAPVDPVAALDELDGDQLLRLCVARELHKAEAAVAEVCNLHIAGRLPQRVGVAGLHAACTHRACLLLLTGVVSV